LALDLGAATPAIIFSMARSAQPTTEVFGEYAAYYDRLYARKNYASECDFVEGLLMAHGGAQPRTILDLGCGTGGHSMPLVGRGYSVVGVDRSASMLREARTKAREAGMKIEFAEGDVRTVRLGRRFDAVLCMFAVIGYQTTNADVAAAFRTVRAHLEPGGLFVFDVWSGLAVLTQPPVDRVRIEAAGTRFIRLSRPRNDLAAQCVDVDYTILEIEGSQVLREVEETHRVRYFFPQELTLFLEGAGFAVRRMCPFLSPDRAISATDFELTVVAEAV
jgi:2-polyprenyl-3-methyl-5-hydroxy-6-metoxy-1,4-benzoquinol methylase